jgi:hypothetical protein
MNTSSAPFERFGWVTKEEPLSIVSDPNLDLNITILESTAPFFGYYADQPREDKPEHLYWLLDQYYGHEKLSRVLAHIRSHCYHKLDGATGDIAIATENYHVVRMHNLKRYSQIHHVQKMFEEQGIKLKKSSRKIQNQMGIISINKFLQLCPLQEGIFKEENKPHRAYFVIPQYISWESFKEVTKEVKFDTSLMFFDAARAAYMERGEIVELVRIYRENLTVDQVISIRERYLKVLSGR